MMAGRFTSRELVRMFTIEAAKTLKTSDEILRLEGGKRADLMCLI